MKRTIVTLTACLVGAGSASGAPFVLNGQAATGAEPYQKFCVACHGEKGDGNGPASVALNPKPRNFADAAGMATLTDEQLYTVVKNGGPAVGKSPLMAPWGAVLNDQQIRDVVAFVKQFAKKK